MGGQKRGFEPIPQKTEELAGQAIEGAFRVHRALGPGLLESVYEVGLCHELAKLNVPFERQVELPVRYGGEELDAGFRIDVWVDRQVVLKLKAVEEIAGIHRAQLMTYLRLSGSRLGFLINFNTPRLKDGLVRMVF